MRHIFNKIVRLFIFLLIFAAVITGGLFLISNYFGDEIEQALVEELNHHLEVKVNVEDIHFSALTHFPYASVTFTNVSTDEDVTIGNGALLRVEEVSVLFNLIDLVKQNYTLNRLRISNGFINLSIDKDGHRNFDIFKKQPQDANTNFKIKLEHVWLKNIGVSYVHYPADQEYLFAINNATLIGQFSISTHDIYFSGEVNSEHIRSGKSTFLTNRNLKLDLRLINEPGENKVEISDARIQTDGMIFDLNGIFITERSNRTIELNIEAEPAKLSRFIKLVPEHFLAPLKGYQIEGNVDFKSSISGHFSGNQLPEISFEFNLSDGHLEHPASGFDLNHVSFSGNFNNGKSRSPSSFKLKLNNVSSEIKGGSLSGNLTVSDFKEPLIQAQLTSEYNLENIQYLFRIDQLESITGKLLVDMSFSNRLKSFRGFTIDDFISSRTAGDLKFSNLNFKVKNNILNFHDFEGAFRFSNKDLIIDTFAGKVSDNDFKMDGYFGNILAFAFSENEPVYINADFYSNTINLDQLLAYSKNAGESPYQLTISKKINFDLDVNIKNFHFRKFDAELMKGQFSMIQQKFYVKKGNLKAMKGEVKLDGMINGSKPDFYEIDCDAVFTDVDIQLLFEQFGNFHQKTLSSEHLRGIVNADVQYKSSLTPTLYVDPASVFTYADVTVSNGELIRFTPLYALSRFIKQEELEHIKFNTLTNKIKIENKIINIPTMVIKSSTMDISFYGTHSFDNITDYHFQLYLADLIRDQKKRKSQEEIEGIFVHEDNSGKPKLFLSMKGPANDPYIKYDTKAVRKKIASDLSQEKEEFKEVMRKEFNWLSKNSAKSKIEEPQKPVDQKDFAIGWDEIKKDSSQVKSADKSIQERPANKAEKQEKNFIIKWDETKDTIR